MHLVALQILAGTLLFMSHADASPGGGLSLKLDTQYERSNDASVAQDRRGTQVVGLSIEAFGGGSFGGAALYVDAHFGAGLTGGFAYNFEFQPLGLSLYDAREGKIVLGLTTGVHLQGVTGHQPLRTSLPLRLFLNFKIRPWAQVSTWGAIDTSLSDSQHPPSSHALWADELRTGIGIRLGPNRSEEMGRGQVSSGNGYFVGATYSEKLGIEFWGIAVGHGVDMAGSPR